MTYGQEGDETDHVTPKRNETIKERIERETNEALGHKAFGGGSVSAASGGVDPFTGASMPVSTTEWRDKLYDRAYKEGFEAGKQDATQYFAQFPVGSTELPTGPKPGPWTQKAIEDVTKVLGSRGHSYTVDEEFENFFKQAEVGDQSIRQVFRGALGQKLHRERATFARIKDALDPDNEDADFRTTPEELDTLYLQWLDSIRDICGYGLLFFGWAKSERDDQ